MSEKDREDKAATGEDKAATTEVESAPDRRAAPIAAQLEAISEPRAKPPPPPRRAASPARGGGGAVAWLALVLVLGLAAASVWQLLELQQRENLLTQRLAVVEGIAGQRDEARREIRDLDKQLREVETRWQAELRAERDSLVQELTRRGQQQREALEAFEASLAQQRAELARYSADDRDAWLLAEAGYLLRLANQRLVMAGDTVSAMALIGSADNILRELDDAGLYGVREAVAEDLAAVRAVPALDIEGIYVAISALIRQADALVIFELPESEAAPAVAPGETWQDRLDQGYRAALAKLSNYVIIRRRDVPVEALMDPQWEGLVRQNLRMLLEQAQVALLSGNQVLYQDSLERAGRWVEEFFVADEAAARALAGEIASLRSRQVAVAVPDLTRSLAALNEAVQMRLHQGGGD